MPNVSCRYIATNQYLLLKILETVSTSCRAREKAVERERLCSLLEATRPMPQGLLDQVLVFLLTLEAIHPFTDFRGYFYCISVGGGFGKNKTKNHSFLQKEKDLHQESLFQYY